MRSPQAALDAVKEREIIYDNPDFVRMLMKTEEALGIKSDEDLERVMGIKPRGK